MPIRSMSDLRQWLAPWVWAAVTFIGLVFALGQPPVSMWPAMFVSILLFVVFAGCVSALLFSVVSLLTNTPLGSRGSFVIAAIAGATVPFFPIPVVVGGWGFSSLLFVAASLISARRLAPNEAVGA
jgi:hypothetical protein